MKLIAIISVLQDCKSVDILPPTSPKAINTATRGHWLPTGAYGLSNFLSLPLNLGVRSHLVFIFIPTL